MGYTYQQGTPMLVTYSGATGTVYFKDAADNLIDFSRAIDLDWQLLVKSSAGGATSLVVSAISSAFNQTTDTDAWGELFDFATVTIASLPADEHKRNAVGHQAYLGFSWAFTGGSAQTWTGFVVVRKVGLSLAS